LTEPVGESLLMVGEVVHPVRGPGMLVRAGATGVAAPVAVAHEEVFRPVQRTWWVRKHDCPGGKVNVTMPPISVAV
jgi:hypothetical protein